jgi:type VI secretion system protein ImpC
MPPKPSSSIVLDVNAGNPAEQPEPLHVEAAPDDPFRILIIGAFSGRQNRAPLGSRRPQSIDRDNFDEVLGRMHVEADLRLDAATTVRLNFTTLADFDPDSIFERCELFRTLRPVRSEQAASTAAETSSSRESKAAERNTIEADAGRLASGSLLDEIVEQADVHRPAEFRSDLQAVIERVVAPHLVRPSTEDLPARDRAYSALMRAILHHPQFQALEAAWRALDLLARGLDTDGALSLHILDATREELESGMDALSPQLTPREPWAIIAGNYVFDHSDRDAALLQRLGELAGRATAPWIAESAPPEEDSGNSEWRALRGSPLARWIGLALPRFLARMPYGRRTYAIESFPFEEISGRPEHNQLLWANPAFACAWLLGRAFNEYGWKFRPGAVYQMAGLPYYSYEWEGEMMSQPCAEVLLTDSQIEFIQEQGVMALAPMKNRDVAMLVRFQSIADPVSALAGRWRRSVNFDDR